MKTTHSSFILICACLTLFYSNQAISQTQTGSKPSKGERSKVITGEFSLETGNKQRDPYQVSEELTYTYLNNLKTKIGEFSNGNITSLERPNEKIVSFLTGTYLYCTVRDTTCPALLDSLLEVDVVNARLANKEECPTLREFWKTYIQNDLENRHRYLTQISQMAAVSEFNTKSRPGYIKCQTTIAKNIKGSSTNTEFFRARYKDGRILKSINSAFELIESLKRKGINVFKELDARTAAATARGN